MFLGEVGECVAAGTHTRHKVGALGDTKVGVLGDTKVGALWDTKVGALGDTKVGALGDTVSMFKDRTFFISDGNNRAVPRFIVRRRTTSRSSGTLCL